MSVASTQEIGTACIAIRPERPWWQFWNYDPCGWFCLRCRLGFDKNGRVSIQNPVVDGKPPKMCDHMLQEAQ